jgi:hypothetical protein
MRKTLFAGLAVVAAVGIAFGQNTGPNLQGGGESYNQGTGSATVSQTIKLTIPPRAALHLVGTEWTVNLNSPTPAADTYTLNPTTLPGVGCYLVPKTVTTPEQLIAYANASNPFKPIDNYPAIKDYNGDNKITDDEKGTLICLNKKRIQIFWNLGVAWKLDVAVTGLRTGRQDGIFGVSAEPFASANTYSPNYPFPDTTLVTGTGSSIPGGWVDYDIYEGFWFNGEERPTTTSPQLITVTFTLTNL